MLPKFEQFIRERQYLHNVSPATVSWHTHMQKVAIVWLSLDSYLLGRNGIPQREDVAAVPHISYPTADEHVYEDPAHDSYNTVCSSRSALDRSFEFVEAGHDFDVVVLRIRLQVRSQPHYRCDNVVQVGHGLLSQSTPAQTLGASARITPKLNPVRASGTMLRMKNFWLTAPLFAPLPFAPRTGESTVKCIWTVLILLSALTAVGQDKPKQGQIPEFGQHHSGVPAEHSLGMKGGR